MIERTARLLFLLSLLTVAFFYGFLSHRDQLFPYEVIQRGTVALDALRTVRDDSAGQGSPATLSDRQIDFLEPAGGEGPHARWLGEPAGGEAVLLLGNESAYQELCGAPGCLAWLADRTGKVLHAWRSPKDLWKPLENHTALGETWAAYPVGAHLYPNGDLLVSYQGTNMFPYGVGLAKFDRDSRLLWRREGRQHHWFTVAEDGRIYVGGSRVAASPYALADSDKRIVCDQREFQVETVEVLDAEGNTLREIDALSALVESGYAGLLHNSGKDPKLVETCDPLHLNDVRTLGESMAPGFPGFAPGDLLLSFRSLNAVGVMDPATERFRWVAAGGFDNAHSPRFLGGGRIALFDNLGGRKSAGTSRVVTIDVGTGRVEQAFPRDGTTGPSRPIFSETAGHIDLSADRRRMLVAWSHQGLVWEIDVATGEVLWEYVNTHLIGADRGRVTVYTAAYAAAAGFPLNGGTPAKTD